jgi:hypothetical protein
LFAYFERTLDGFRYEAIVYELISFVGEDVSSYFDLMQERYKVVNEERYRLHEAYQGDCEAMFRLDGKRLLDALHGWHCTVDAPSVAPGWYSEIANKLQGAERALHSVLPSYSPADPEVSVRAFSIDSDCRLQNAFVAARSIPQYDDLRLSRSIIHGDLHGHNILCEPRRVASAELSGPSLMIIDFEDVTANGHTALDYATLECDFKFRWARSSLGADLLSRLRLELDLAKHLGESDVLRQLDTEMPKVGSNLAMALHFRERQLKKLREVAFEELWGERRVRARIELCVALLFQSLRYLEWFDDVVGRLHVWFSACLAATIVMDFCATEAILARK